MVLESHSEVTHARDKSRHRSGMLISYTAEAHGRHLGVDCSGYSSHTADAFYCGTFEVIAELESRNDARLSVSWITRCTTCAR